MTLLYRRGCEKSQFSTNISLYLGNGTIVWLFAILINVHNALFSGVISSDLSDFESDLALFSMTWRLLKFLVAGCRMYLYQVMEHGPGYLIKKKIVEILPGSDCMQKE